MRSERPANPASVEANTLRRESEQRGVEEVMHYTHRFSSLRKSTPPNNGARLPPSFNTLAGLTQEVRYSQAWRYIPVIPALRRMKYKEPVFGAYLGYLQELSQKQTTKHHNNKNMKQTKQKPINLYL